MYNDVLVLLPAMIRVTKIIFALPNVELWRPDVPWTWEIRWFPTLSVAIAITTEQVAKVVVYSYRSPKYKS